MADEKFKELIRDIFNLSKVYRNVSGLLYSSTSTYGFSNIINFVDFFKKIQINMINIKSSTSNTKINVHKEKLEDYSIDKKKKIINIKLKDQPEQYIRY